LRETLFDWIEDGVVHRGAALAYYVLLSLGPALLLLVEGLQVFFAREAVRGRVLEAISRFVGARAADTARTVLEDAQAPSGFSLTSLLTIGAVLFAATAVFANVRGSLNAIWGVEKAEEGAAAAERDPEILLGYLRGFLRTRGFVMIVMTGLILLVSFALTSTANVLGRLLGAPLPLGSAWMQVTDAVLSIAVIGLLFGTIFRTMPERRIDHGFLGILLRARDVGGRLPVLGLLVGADLLLRGRVHPGLGQALRSSPAEWVTLAARWPRHGAYADRRDHRTGRPSFPRARRSHERDRPGPPGETPSRRARSNAGEHPPGRVGGARGAEGIGRRDPQVPLRDGRRGLGHSGGREGLGQRESGERTACSHR
jgi:uncharacterized BrkB/YihY/UPF0761 family membrane protein